MLLLSTETHFFNYSSFLRWTFLICSSNQLPHDKHPPVLTAEADNTFHFPAFILLNLQLKKANSEEKTGKIISLNLVQKPFQLSCVQHRQPSKSKMQQNLF